MVEMHTSKKAEMVRLLLAVHRWAVTGTPIQKSIQGLKSKSNCVCDYFSVFYLIISPNFKTDN